LTGRIINVKIGNCKSVHMNIDIGIPQGNNLGPDLFNVVINDMPEHVKSEEIIGIYADDINATITGKNIEEIKRKGMKTMQEIRRFVVA
jgi:Reverse transcriptase (RNA-dependent DNA polymerase).